MTASTAGVGHLARGAAAAVRLNLIVSSQYRANMAMWSVASILQIVVYLSVWQAVANSGGAAGGYTAAQFAGYFLVLLFVREMTMTWMPYEVSGYVRSGKLSPMLLRPLHPLAYIASGMVAFRIQSTMVTIPIAVMLFVAFDAQVDTSPAALLVGLLLVLPLASCTRFLADTLLAITALWLTRIDGIRGIYYLLLLLLGGQFAPLSVLPGALEATAKALPFYWTLGYPTELLVGRATLADAWIGMAVLAAWSTVLLFALQVVWRRGIRAYEAVGS